MCLAVARWWKVHRPLLALRGKTVPCLVPRCSERLQTTAYPFHERRSSEHFHWLRTLRPEKHNRRTILVRGMRRSAKSVGPPVSGQLNQLASFRSRSRCDRWGGEWTVLSRESTTIRVLAPIAPRAAQALPANGDAGKS